VEKLEEKRRQEEDAKKKREEALRLQTEEKRRYTEFCFFFFILQDYILHFIQCTYDVDIQLLRQYFDPFRRSRSIWFPIFCDFC